MSQPGVSVFSPGAGCNGKGDQQPPFAAWLRNSRFAMSSWVVTRVSSGVGPRILLYSYLQGQAAGSSSSSLLGLSFSTSHWAPVSGWWMLPMPCELLKATVSQCELSKCLIVFDSYWYSIDVYWCYIRCFYLFLVVSVGPGLALLLVLLQCLNIQFCRWQSSILQPMSLPHFTRADATSHPASRVNWNLSNPQWKSYSGNWWKLMTRPDSACVHEATWSDTVRPERRLIRFAARVRLFLRLFSFLFVLILFVCPYSISLMTTVPAHRHPKVALSITALLLVQKTSAAATVLANVAPWLLTLVFDDSW